MLRPSQSQRSHQRASCGSAAISCGAGRYSVRVENGTAPTSLPSSSTRTAARAGEATAESIRSRIEPFGPTALDRRLLPVARGGAPAQRAPVVVGGQDPAVEAAVAHLGGRHLRRRAQRQQLEPAVVADEVATKSLAGWASSSAGGPNWAMLAALLQDRDAVAEQHRLVDVVGDEHDRLAELALQAQELAAAARRGTIGSTAPNGSSISSTRRVGGERPGDADALLLAAGELAPGSGRPCPASSPTSSSSSSERVRWRSLSQPSSCGTVAMLSATVRCGNRPACWIT